jgi:hypothetical protein
MQQVTPTNTAHCRAGEAGQKDEIDASFHVESAARS